VESETQKVGARQPAFACISLQKLKRCPPAHTNALTLTQGPSQRDEHTSTPRTPRTQPSDDNHIELVVRIGLCGRVRGAWRAGRARREHRDLLGGKSKGVFRLLGPHESGLGGRFRPVGERKGIVSFYLLIIIYRCRRRHVHVSCSWSWCIVVCAVRRYCRFTQTHP